MLPSPDQNLKIGSVGRDFFFFFFLRTVRELSFPIFFFKFLNGENSGGMQSKRIYHASAFLSHGIQILANSSPKSDIKKKKKKKNDPVFSHGRSGEGNITIFFWPYDTPFCWGVEGVGMFYIHVFVVFTKLHMKNLNANTDIHHFESF